MRARRSRSQHALHWERGRPARNPDHARKNPTPLSPSPPRTRGRLGRRVKKPTHRHDNPSAHSLFAQQGVYPLRVVRVEGGRRRVATGACVGCARAPAFAQGTPARGDRQQRAASVWRRGMEIAPVRGVSASDLAHGSLGGDLCEQSGGGGGGDRRADSRQHGRRAMVVGVGRGRCLLRAVGQDRLWLLRDAPQVILHQVHFRLLWRACLHRRADSCGSDCSCRRAIRRRCTRWGLPCAN